VAAAVPSLDGLAAGDPAVTLRWTMVKMIQEYARHNGHADLLRECIDGAVGEEGRASSPSRLCREGVSGEGKGATEAVLCFAPSAPPRAAARLRRRSRGRQETIVRL